MTYTIAQCYSRGSTPFGASGPYYTPGVGHRGKDYDHGARETIVAYKEMVIEFVDRNPALGLVIGARFTDGSGYCGFAHLANLQNFTNGLVPAGVAFAEAATGRDSPGSSWTGPHIHTTYSPVSSRNAALGILPLGDPAPIIAAAIKGSASAGTVPESVKEAIMSNGGVFIRNNTPGYKFKGKPTFGAVALVAPGFVNPQTSMDVVRAMAPVYGVPIELTGDQYHTVIRECQINRAGQKGVE